MILKIDEVDYKLSWGMGCLEMFCDALDCEIKDLDKALQPCKEQIKYITTLIECAVKNGLELDSYWGECDVSYRRLQRFLDESDESVLKDIIGDFTASKYFGKTIVEHLMDQVQEDDTTTGKKKLPSEE